VIEGGSVTRKSAPDEAEAEARAINAGPWKTDSNVSTEARGLARDFMRRAHQEFNQSELFIGSIWDATVAARWKRAPHSRMRPDVWRAFAYRWQHEAPQAFRVDFEAQMNGRRGWVRETKFAIIEMRDPDNPDWKGKEDGVAVVARQAVLDKSMRIEMPVVLARFSLHALARRIERGRDDRVLMADMAVVLTADWSDVPHGLGYEYVDPDKGFGWRGYISLWRPDTAKPPTEHKLFNVRTFF
jgi:hypothetical protein